MYTGTNLTPYSSGWLGIYNSNPNAFNSINNLDPNTINPNTGSEATLMSPVYPAVASQSLYHGLNPYTAGNNARESDANCYSCSPGERIVFYVWLKSGSSGGQDPNAGIGGDNPAICAGWDWYGSKGRITALWSDAQQEDTAGIPWNASWTLITINVIVPSTVNGVTPTGFYPWIGGDSVDSGNEWFSNTAIYINPTIS